MSQVVRQQLKLSERMAVVRTAPQPQPAEIEHSSGEWLPDLPDFNNPGLTVAKNAVPLSSGAYGPMEALEPYSTALDDRCQGARSLTSFTGAVNIFAGDASKLYRIQAGSNVPADVSKAAGYSTSPNEIWDSDTFGQQIFFTNFQDAIQKFDLAVDSLFSDLSGDAPKARYLATIAGFLVAGNTDTAPNQIHWSAANDPSDWPILGSADAAAKQSDAQDFAIGGDVTALAGGLRGADGVVFQENAVRRMTLSSPTVFAIKEVQEARGTSAPNSLIKLGGNIFYYGEDGFYRFDGLNSEPIGINKIDRYFEQRVDAGNLVRISGGVDLTRRCLFWLYPGLSSMEGAPNRMLAFKWDVGRWAEMDFDAEILLRTETFGQTLEDLDAFGTLETLPASLDARIWVGGANEFGAFDKNKILSYFTGAALDALFETGEFSGNGRRLICNGIRPITDAATPQCSVGHRETQSAAVTYTAATSPQINGVCDQRVSARYMRARVSIPSQAWTTISQANIRAEPDAEK